MKKYLLLFLMCVYASIGAWAEDAKPTITCNNWHNDADWVVLNSPEAGSVASGLSDVLTNLTNEWSWKFNLKVTGIINTADVEAISQSNFGLSSNTSNTIDFSEANLESGTSLALSTGTSIHGIRVPQGYDLSSDFGAAKYAFTAGLTGAKSHSGDTTQGDDAITLNILQTGGLTDFITTWSTKTYLIRYRNVSIYKNGNYTPEELNSLRSAVIADNVGSVTEISAPSNDPYTVYGCTITINMAKAGEKSFATLLAEAKNKMTEVDATQTSICTLIVQGTVSDTELEALNDANLSSATKIDLSGATIATGSSINNITLPSSIRSLILPPNQTVKGTTLETTLSTTNCPNLLYAYSPSSDSQKPGPNEEDQFDSSKNLVADYVWVNTQGALPTAFTNEEQLRNSYYIKVASSVALTATDVDFDTLGIYKPSNYLFLDFSESNLTPAVAASYKVTDDIGYRIILPNGWTGDQMAVFAANPNCGELAAVYSYNGTGNTRLDILEIHDGSYMTNALTNPRIVRSGTTAIQVLGGSYNGQVYRSFGDNLLAAINNAQSVTSIKSVKISTGGELPASSFTFTNNNIETLDLSGVNRKSDYYKGLVVSACSSLQTLNLSDANVLSVTASGATSLTSVNLTGATIESNANFSGTALATFTTNNETIIGNSTSSGNGLDLSSTNLTSFSTAAKIGGDINLSACNNLSSIDLRQTTFANQWTNPYNSTIHIHETNDENDTNVITKLGNKSILVVNGFDEEHRIHPYNQTIANLIDEQEYIAPDCEFSATDMTLHEPEVAADGDKLVYWYAGDMVNEGVGTVTMKTESDLSTIISTYQLDNAHVKVKIVGPLKVADVQALKDINATVLDLSKATSGEDGTTIQALLADEFDGASLNANTKFLIAPDGSTRENLINGTSLAGLINIWSVVATEGGINKKSVQNLDLPEGYNFTSYSKKSGTLQAATVMALASSTGDYTRTPNIGGTATSKRVYLSSISTFRDVTISGTVNAYDMCKSTTVDQYGHLEWTRHYTEAAIEGTGYSLTGQDVYGPFGSCFNLTAIDLEGAKFEQTNPANNTAHDYVADMTLSALNVLSANATCKVVIPTDPSVQDIPADFMNSSIAIDAICIPYNIKRIRSRAFNTIDYIWTTSGSNNPEGTNTKLDNGAEYDSDETVTYATNWDGDKKVKDTFSYIVEPTGGSYTFSANIELIESGAFANTRPHVKDVYVLNKFAPECHVDAFNTVMYLGNGGYAPVITEGIITRDSYQNNGFWITMLHYPRQTVSPDVQRYTDPTRDYSIATGMRDGKGATIYFPNQSEFIRAYTQGTYGYTWNAWDPTREYGSVDNGGFANVTLSAYNSGDQAKANTEYNNYKTAIDAKGESARSNIEKNHPYYSFYDVTAGGATTKPTDLIDYNSIHWDESSYNNTGSTGVQLYPENKDYRGWHQFVLNAYAANTTLESEPYRSYITDNEWWTICPTFDITYEQAILLFGTPATGGVTEQRPHVSKLQYVRRDYDNNVIALNFSRNLMEYPEDREQKKVTTTVEDGKVIAVHNASQHGRVDDNGVVRISDTKDTSTEHMTDVVMSAGVPYMIKPYMPNGNKRMFQVFKNQEEANKLIAQYAAAGTDMSTLPFKMIVNETLYNTMHFALNKTGEQQMAMVESGLYSVPVFVKGTTTETTDKGEHDPYTINGVNYQKSKVHKYTFVGTFYKSYLPGRSYFLGWDKKASKAKFFYNDKPDAHEMRWSNETGIICPTAPDYTFTVTHATGGASGEPAQWKLGTPLGTKTTDAQYGIETYWLPGDDLATTGGSGAKKYEQYFDSPDVISVVTGINEIDAEEDTKAYGNADVYSVNGQKVGTSLEGLPKGIYIVNGKKFIVK